MLHVVLDLSRHRVDVHVLGSDGERVLVTRAPAEANGLRCLTERLDEYGQPVHAAIESMNRARFMHDQLELAGWGRGYGGRAEGQGSGAAGVQDRIDAWVLAELSRRDLVPAIWLPTPGVLAERGAPGGCIWCITLWRCRSGCTDVDDLRAVTSGVGSVRRAGHELLQRLACRSRGPAMWRPVCGWPISSRPTSAAANVSHSLPSIQRQSHRKSTSARCKSPVSQSDRRGFEPAVSGHIWPSIEPGASGPPPAFVVVHRSGSNQGRADAGGRSWDTAANASAPTTNPATPAYYDDLRGRRRSAGTYSSRKDADRAWQTAETDLRAGRPGDPATGRITFTNYVTGHWFPHHVLEPTTRESYRYNLDRHITPWFGPMKMADILPIHVREWVSHLINHGVTPATIRHQKIILSAIFTTALNDYVIPLHPCKGVKTPTVPVNEYRILSPDEIARLLVALPNDPARLLVKTAIGSGLRWGELIELRPHDLHPASGILTVTRAVVELHPDDHPTGDRFLIKPYPKSKRSRRFRLDPTLIAALRAHIKQHRLASDDLLFGYDTITAEESAPAPLTLVEDLGLTDPTPTGRRYRHGTLSARWG